MSRSGINPPIRKSARDIRAGPRYVRFTPKADIRQRDCHVCFGPKQTLSWSAPLLVDSFHAAVLTVCRAW